MAAFDDLFGNADQATDQLYAYADEAAPGAVDRDSFADRNARKYGSFDWSDHADPYDEYRHIRRDLGARPAFTPRSTKPSATDFSEQAEPAGKERAPDFSSFGEPVAGAEAEKEQPEAPEQPPPPLGVGGQVAAGAKAAVQAGAAGVTDVMKGAAALPEITKQAYDQGKPTGEPVPENPNLAAQNDPSLAARLKLQRSGPYAAASKATEKQQQAEQEKLAEEMKVPPQERPIYKAAEKMQKAVEGFAPLSDQEKDSVGAKIGGFIGGAAAPVATTLAGSAIGMPELGLVLGATQMGMQNAGASFERALNAGASPEQAAKAAGMDGLVGAALGGLPLGAILAPVKVAGKPILDLAGNEIGRQAAPGLMGWMAVKLEQAVKSGVTFSTVGEAQEWLSKQIASEYNAAAVEKLQNDKAAVQRQLDRMQSDPKIAEANKDLIQQGKAALSKFDDEIANAGKYKLDWERVAISFFGGGALGMLHPHGANAQAPDYPWPPMPPDTGAAAGTGLGAGTPPPGGGGAGGGAGGAQTAGAGGAAGPGPSSQGAGGTPPPRAPRPPPNDTTRQAGMRGTFEGAMGRAGVDVEQNLPFDELRNVYHAFDGLTTAYKRTDLKGMRSEDLVDFFDQLSALNNHGFDKKDLTSMSRADVAREFAEMVKQGGTAGPPPPGAEQWQQPNSPGQGAQPGANTQPPPGQGAGAQAQGATAGPTGATAPGETPAAAGGGAASETPQESVVEQAAPGTRANPIDLNTADDIARAGAVASQEHSHAQGEAHNVPQGWGTWNGLSISLEAPAGGVRRGTNPETGEPWEHRVAIATGYIANGPNGADGDKLDVYVGPQPTSPTVFVLDELNPEDGKFRQTKNFIGLTDPREVLAAYLGTEGKTPPMIGGITSMTVPQFKAWVADGDHKVPVRGQVVPPAQTMDLNALPVPAKEVAAGSPAPAEGQGGSAGGATAGAPSLAQEHQTEPEHVRAIEDAIAATGHPIHDVAPNDIALAAELHAHGVPPDLAFELAVLRNAVDQKYLTEQQLVDIYGKQKAEAALSGISPIVEPVSPGRGAGTETQRPHAESAAPGHPEENGVLPRPGAHVEGHEGAKGGVQAAPHAGAGEPAPAVDNVAGGGGGEGAAGPAAGHERPAHAHGRPGEAPHHAAGRPGERPGHHAEAAEPHAGAAHAEAAPAAEHGAGAQGGAPARPETAEPKPRAENGPAGEAHEPHAEAGPAGEAAAGSEAAPAEAAAPEAAGGQHGERERDLLVKSIVKVLDERNGITSKRLQDLASEAYGGKLADGAFDRKDMYDALETAINVTIANHPGLHLGIREAPEAVNQKLEELLSKLPTQTVRSEEQVKFQQFSTPPNYAMAVAYAAGLRNGDVVLEPSAGTGSLVAAATHPGVAVHANELSPRRAALLKLVMDAQHVVRHNEGRLFKENAEQLDNILPDDIKPTVVVMNPPFSQTAGRMGDKKDLMVAANHIDQALKRLEPGGRLVAIVGQGMTPNSPTYRDWWKKIGAKYSVQANIGVDGKVYSKYGTSFGTRVLVIDKPAGAAEPGQLRAPHTGKGAGTPLTADAKSVSELLQLLKGIRDARSAGERRPSEPGGAAVSAEGGRAGGPEQPLHPGAGAVGSPAGGAGGVPGQGSVRGGGTGGAPVSVGPGGRAGVAGGPSGGGAEGGAGEKSTEHAGGGERPGHGGERPVGVDLQPPAGGESGTATLDKLRPAYEAIKQEQNGLSTVWIGDLIQRSGLPALAVKRALLDAAKAGVVSLHGHTIEEAKVPEHRKQGYIPIGGHEPRATVVFKEPVAKKPEKSETVAPPGEQPYSLDTLKAKADEWSKRAHDTNHFEKLVLDDDFEPRQDQTPILKELAQAERDWNDAVEHVRRNEGVDDKTAKQKGRPWSGVIQGALHEIKTAIQMVENTKGGRERMDAAREKLAKGEQKAAGAAGPPPGEKAGLEDVKPGQQAKTEFTEGLYEHYEPQKVKVKGSQPHPGPLVESASMATVPPPDAKYQPSLPKNVIETGALSTAQLEPIVYAGQAHSQMLPHSESETPRRKGYFIGDGTGVGKGREIAGIILDNWNQGRKKAVWVSEKKPLLNDAKRDWKGLGQNPSLIFELGTVKAGEPIKAVHGISFVTYDTLKGGMSDQAALAQGGYVKGDKVRSKDTGATGVVTGKGKKRGNDIVVPVLLDNGTKVELSQHGIERTEERQSVKSRVDQLVDWLGKDFDGVIAFDESHNLGNSVQQQGARGQKGAAMKAIAGVQLAERLPKARVVYVSATGATEVSNLSYADRLGLWGRGTPFASRANFVSEVESGGIAAMELIARDMKQMGLYTARNLSYDGVEYGRIEHKLNTDQKEIYNTLATAWQHVLQNIEAALEVTGGDNNARAKSAAKSAFWGAHQRFFNQIITSLQMPSVIKAVEKDIKEGRQAVLQLTNTNAASQERAAAKAESAEDIEDMDITPRDQIIQLIEKSFPTQQYEEFEDEKGNKSTRPVVDSEGNPVENKEAVRMRDALIERVATVRVPQGPLDMILDHFGYENVAEVTGRGRRFIMKEDAKGIRRRMEESRPQSSNVAEADAFQAGKKKILVFSEAGGTGRSYHADNTSASAGARRSHYLVQGGWRADKAVQGFGRTHRTNQASAPVFNLVTTDLHGQKRFISSIARRLAQLGALTKGERAAGDQGIFGARDNLESTEAKLALKSFFGDLYNGKLEISLNEFERQTGLAIAQRDKDGNNQGMRNELPEITQFLNRLLSLNINEMNATFEAFSNILDSVIEARRQAGVLDQGLETVKADKIRKDSEKTVFKGEGGAETKYVKFTTSNKFVPIPFKSVIGNNARPVIGWVKSPQGRVYAISNTPSYTNEQGQIIDNYRLTGPGGTRTVPQGHITGSSAFPTKWVKIQEPDAAKIWADEIRNAPEFVDGDLHLITGAILPVWDRLKGQTRVVRLQTDDGERYLGRVIPAGQLSATLKALGAEGAQEKIDASRAFPALQNGAIATLANGWRISRRLVAGESRIEISGPSSIGDRNQLVGDGVFTETIQYKARYFIPTGTEGEKVLARIIQYRPIVSLEGGERGERSEMFGGPKGETANLANLEAAKAAKAAGKDPYYIWRETGWMERPDGWRYEIDDSKVQFKRGALVGGESRYGGHEFRFDGKLGDLVEAKALPRVGGEAPFLRAYPSLKDNRVTIGSMHSFVASASVDPTTGHIKISGFGDEDEILKSLLHEVQHLVQRHEGFDSGGSGGTLHSRTRAALYEIEQQIKRLRPGSNIRAELEALRKRLADQAELFGGGTAGWSQTNEETDAYRRLLGEVEARNTELRQKMSAQERREKLPTETEDIPQEEQYAGKDLVQMTPKLKAAIDRTVRDEWRGYVPDSRYNSMSLSPQFGGENNPKPLPTSRSNISPSMKFTPQSVADAIRVYGGQALIDHIDQHISYAQTGPVWEGKPVHIDHEPHPKQIETLEHVRGVIQRVVDRYPDAAKPSSYVVGKMDPEGLIDRYTGKTWTEDDVQRIRGRVEDAIEEMGVKGELTQEQARELSYDFHYQGMTIAEWHPEGFAKVYAKIPALIDEYKNAFDYTNYAIHKSNAGLSYKLKPGAAVKQTAIEQLIRKQLQDMVGRHVDIDLTGVGDLGPSQTWGKLASMEGDQTPAAYYPRRSKLSGRPLHGIIKLAMGGNRPFKMLRSYANHEAVHALIDLAATDQEIEVLKRERARNGPKVQEALGLTDQEMGELNPDEIDAVAGEMYMDERDAGGPGTAGGWHVALRALWERIRQFLRRIGNAIRGLGFQTSEDIFESMRQGEMRDRPMRESFGMQHGGWEDEAQVGARTEAPFAMFNRSRQRKQQRTAGQRVKAQMESMPTRAVRYWADRMIDVLNVQRQIERATGQPLPPEQQPYLHETLYGGRTGERALDLERKYTMPIIDDLKANGISRKDFDDYLYARHAQARNAFIARINPRMPDGGSGMKNNEAQAILNYANGGPKAPVFQRNAQRVYDMLDESLRNQVAYGLVSQQWANDVWRDFGQEYVPLKGFEEFELPSNETIGSGAGPAYTVSGRENMEALGRRSEATQILANSVLQATNTIIRGEKNRVVGAMYDLARSHPDPSLWTLSNTERKRFKDANGQVVERLMPVNRSAPNVLVHKIGGQEHAIILHHQPIADAMKALGVDDAGEVVRKLRYTMQAYGRLRTSLSPEFVLKNFERDQTDANVAVVGRYGARGAAFYNTNMPIAIKGAWDVALNRPSAAHALYDRFRLAGGKMSFIKGTNIENIAHEIQQHMDRGRVRAMFDKTVEVLETASDISENSTRMNLFATALHFGASDEEAASFALEGTINFRRKGRGAVAQFMAAIWPFFNANVQSVLRYGRMLGGRQVSSLWPISKRVARGFMGAMMVGGFLSTLFNIHVGGHNEHRGQSFHHDVPEYEKMTNIIVMTSGKDKAGQPYYVKIPMFSEAMAPWRIGSLAAEWAFDNRSTGYVGKQFLITATNMIPGLGSSHMGIPTLANIPLSIYMNENNFGGKIHPEPSWFSHEAHEPASQVQFPNTAPFWKSAAETVGTIGGGDKYRSPWGPMNVHPEDVRFIANELGGGLIGFGIAGINIVNKIANGMAPSDIDVREWPFARQWAGHNYNVQISRDFNEARKSAEEAAEAVKRGDKRPETRKEANTADIFKNATKTNSALNKEEGRVRANTKLSFSEIEKRIQELDAKRTQNRADALRRAEGVATPTPLRPSEGVATPRPLPTAPKPPPPKNTKDLLQRMEQAR